MQPGVTSQGALEEGVWSWKVPSAVIQAVPTQARNTKRCQMLCTLLRIAIIISVSLFANTGLGECESHTKAPFRVLACPLASPSASCGSQTGYRCQQPKQR